MPGVPAYDRERVVALFEKHRQTPGASFDESHFLDYLLADPKRRQAVFRSFRGLRRLDAFIRAVQLEFFICFSADDRRSNYPLPDFVHRIAVLRESPRSSLSAWKRQRHSNDGWAGMVAFDLLALLGGALVWPHWWWAGALLLLALIVSGGYLALWLRERAYQKKLLTRLRRHRSA